MPYHRALRFYGAEKKWARKAHVTFRSQSKTNAGNEGKARPELKC